MAKKQKRRLKRVLKDIAIATVGTIVGFALLVSVVAINGFIWHDENHKCRNAECRTVEGFYHNHIENAVDWSRVEELLLGKGE